MDDGNQKESVKESNEKKPGQKKGVGSSGKKKNLNKVAQWYLIDGKDQVLGRLASEIAILLRGKKKVDFVPYLGGDIGVIVTNAREIVVTGKKRKNKIYYRHTGYPGGLKKTNYEDMLKRRVDYPLRHAVKGMLPKNRLANLQMSRLKIYGGAEHPHGSQNPVEWKPIRNQKKGRTL